MFLGKGNYNDFGTPLDLRQDNDFNDTTVKIKKDVTILTKVTIPV